MRVQSTGNPKSLGRPGSSRELISSLIIFRGDIRYKWKHSIPLPDSSPSLSEMEELGVGSGQRLSVMVRVSRDLYSVLNCAEPLTRSSVIVRIAYESTRDHA